MVAHSKVFLSKCAQFRDEGQFIDVHLKVREDIFPAHRIVLAANSDYFHAMFTDGMKESNQEVIELKDESISPDALKIVVDSIYTGDLLVNEENVFEVLAAADHLQVTSVVKLCCDFLLMQCIQVRFDVETFCRVWTVADRHGLKDLQEASELEMASKFKDVCESEEFLTHIGADQLCSLLSRDDLSASSETFIFRSVIQWIKYKKEERMAAAAKVIGAVRLGLVDIRVVIEELNTEEMQRDLEIAIQLHQLLIYNNSPSHNFAVEKVKPRSMKSVLVAILPQTEMQYFDVETKIWKLLPSMAQLTDATECYCAEYVGNYLYVAAEGEGNYVNYRYGTVSNSWETLPQILSHDDFCNRQIDSLCSVDDFLYAIGGGSTCVPFRYSPAKNNWQGGANLSFAEKQLNSSNNRLTNAAAAVWKSHIYVLHGLKTAEDRPCLVAKTAEEKKTQPNSGGAPLFEQPLRAGTFSRSTASAASSTIAFPAASQTSIFAAPAASQGTAFGVVSHGGQAVRAKRTSQVWVDKSAVLHCFDPKTNKWKKLSSTCRPHSNSGLFVVNNRLYIAGACTHNSQSGLVPHDSAPVEVYDDGNDTWSVVEQKHIPPNNLGAVEIEGRVYFMVNKFPVDVGIRIPQGEVYQICLNDWKNLAQINEDAILCYMPVKTENLNNTH